MEQHLAKVHPRNLNHGVKKIVFKNLKNTKKQKNMCIEKSNYFL